MSRESDTTHLTAELRRLLLAVVSLSVEWGNRSPGGGWEGIAVSQLRPCLAQSVCGVSARPVPAPMRHPLTVTLTSCCHCPPGATLGSAFRQVSLLHAQARSPRAQLPATQPPAHPHPPACRPLPRLDCSRSQARQGFISKYFSVRL